MGFLKRLFSKTKKTPEAVEERNTLNLEVGDIVTYDLADYEVVGKLTYRDGSYEWYSYQLLEGRNTKWLSSEMDEELELGMFEKVHLPVDTPYPAKLEYDGLTYHKKEEGVAKVIGEGRSSNLQGESVRYGDYLADDEEHMLSLEAWGTEVEVSVGTPLQEYELNIIAGSK
ncbi:hypothetical protein AAV35_004590 [Salimicrobium jeotgali]|uniref:DUF4178 domain-containing protein n=1 Tax=Salimicrobium jeotgali TaxID=1230341 RepID=K2G976_9BACI|nr:DUF4178 domain-containing protein [Salimicrobium jeotgali]AKG04129.1 hypothetical protein AAV35_004590 [Salimicrobium jeotgali]EKE30952.1 hypothetical protein MJ3_10920 [Salimicrobium jeotgali]MBM7697417.1 hypothetical protein [Salimicrobium jeotgali]